MATIPSSKTLINSTVDILNVIRTNGSSTYQERVPLATQTNITQIGNALLSFESTQNEFLSALVNRIGKVIVTSKLYENPLKEFKKGILETGETIEEIFVNIAEAQSFDPATAETEVFKREIPDVKSAFHMVNIQNFYKTTVSQEQLSNAFLSLTGVTDLITKIVESLYNGANTDEFLYMKNLIEQYGTAGRFYPVIITEPTDESTAKGALTKIKSYINKLTFMKSDYNYMNVLTHTEKKDMVLIINTDFDALIDVQALAYAFNMDKADVETRKILIDDFGVLDTDTNKVIAVLVDRDWFMVYDKMIKMTEQINAQGLYWNYFYHVWKIMSTSPFSNAVIFQTGSTSITSVTISPDTVTMLAGGTQQFLTTVVNVNNANDDVAYTISGQVKSGTSITPNGFLTIASDETSVQIIVTVTSVFDETKTDTATITVGSGE